MMINRKAKTPGLKETQRLQPSRPMADLAIQQTTYILGVCTYTDIQVQNTNIARLCDVTLACVVLTP